MSLLALARRNLILFELCGYLLLNLLVKVLCFSLDAQRKKPLQSANQAVQVVTHRVKSLLYFRCSQHRHFNQLVSFIKVGNVLSEFANDVFLEVFSLSLAGLFFNFVPLVANKQSRLSSNSTALLSIVEFFPVAQDTQKLKAFNQKKSSNETLVPTQVAFEVLTCKQCASEGKTNRGGLEGSLLSPQETPKLPGVFLILQFP